jgi:uncharacterized protein DUF998
MRRIIFRVTAVVPLAAMLVQMIWSLFVPGYSSVGQQLSELDLLHNPIAIASRIISFIVGLPLLAFGLTLLFGKAPRMVFTGAASLLLGASMTSTGIFVIGSPLHALHGVAIVIILVPACYAAELPRQERAARFAVTISLIVAFANLAYVWLLFSHLDRLPGLTQRMSILIMFGWYSYASTALLRITSP